MNESLPFWKTKTLDTLSREEWESLCDGCGRCCLVKLEEEETGEIHYTNVACRMLDCTSGHCKDYAQRKRHVPDCVTLTPDIVRSVDWLPPSCAYRLMAEGRELYWWHPLVSGDPQTIYAAGVSVRGRVACSDKDMAHKGWERHIVRWPAALPRAPRPRQRKARSMACRHDASLSRRQG